MKLTKTGAHTVFSNEFSKTYTPVLHFVILKFKSQKVFHQVAHQLENQKRSTIKSGTCNRSKNKCVCKAKYKYKSKSTSKSTSRSISLLETASILRAKSNLDFDHFHAKVQRRLILACP